MIKIKELKKNFEKYNFNIECRHLVIETGKSLGVFGETGSGKTLFTKITAGLAGNFSGSVEIAMTELKSTYRKKIGYIPFRNVLYGNLSLKEMSHFLLSQYKVNLQEFDLKLKWFSEFWDLRSFVDKKIYSLTDGQLQTVKIFIAMLHSPSVLIIDEPFNGLGSGNIEKLKVLFNEIQQREVTILAVSSYRDLIEMITDGITIISNGKIE